MIKVCIADNFPVVHFGVKYYFKDNAEISIVANVGNFLMVRDILLTKEIDVLVLDLELEGLSSIFEVKALLKTFPKTKIVIYSGLSEQIYAPNAIKAGVSGFVHKKEKLETVLNNNSSVSRVISNVTLRFTALCIVALNKRHMNALAVLDELAKGDRWFDFRHASALMR